MQKEELNRMQLEGFMWLLFLIPCVGFTCLLSTSFKPLKQEAQKLMVKENSLPLNSTYNFVILGSDLSDSIFKAVEIVSVLKQETEILARCHQKNGYPQGGPGLKSSRLAFQKMVKLKENVNLASSLLSTNPRVAIDLISRCKNESLRMKNDFRKDDVLETYEFARAFIFAIAIYWVICIIWLIRIMKKYLFLLKQKRLGFT